MEVEGRQVVQVSGNECPRGEGYAIAEIESPVRTLTSTVLALGLSLKTLPVRTDGPIPKARMGEAMQEIRKLRIARRVRAGDAVVEGFLGLDVKLVARREASCS